MRRFGAVLMMCFVLALSGSAWAQATGKKTIYFVDNMTCGACLATISKGVAGVDADAVVTGNPARGVVVVYHDAGIEADTIGSSITETGYPARVMASVNVEPGEMKPALGNASGAVGGACCAGTENSGCGGITESWKTLYRAMKERLAPEPATARNE